MEDQDTQSTTPVDRTSVEALIKSALADLATGRKAIALAIGKAYTVYRLGDLPTDRDWLKAQINAFNNEIDAFNKTITENSKLSADQKAAQKKIKADGPDGVTSIPAVVRFVFTLNTKKQTSIASRYATAVSWVERQFGNEEANLDLPEKIANRIVQEGGLNTIIEDQKAFEANDPNAAARRAEEEKIATAVHNRKIAFLKSDTSLATVPAGDVIDHDGLVLLVGRRNGTSIDVLHPINADKHILDQAIDSGLDLAISGTDHSAELIGRMLRLGSLVDEAKGKSSIPANRGDVADDKNLDITRTMTLRQTPQGKSEIVLSPRRASSSILVSAIAKNGALPSVTQPMWMLTRDRKRCETHFSDKNKRWLFKVDFETRPKVDDDGVERQRLYMNVTNSAVTDSDKKPKEEGFYWSDFSKVMDQPLARAESFSPQFSVGLSLDQIREAYREFLMGWRKARQDKKKHADTIHIAFKDGEMILSAERATKLTIPTQSNVPQPHSMQFRAEDLVKLFERLIEQKTRQFTLNGDDTGMLQITWTDELADYDLSIPTVMSEGVRNPKHFDKLRVA